MKLLTAVFLTTLLAVARVDAADPVEYRTGEASPGYRIGPEDVLQISVWNNDKLSRTVPVRPDGMISLALLNDVAAAGLTPMELRELLMKKLADFVPSPEVSVVVTEVHSPKISVIGQVLKPGRFDLRSSATVVDALAMAGGLTEFAARSRILVLRPDSHSPKLQKIRFDYDGLKASNGDQTNFYLRAGDVVLVP
jgi:polysaccharide biosynthesis/export protein